MTRLLLVEDNPGDVVLLREALEATGWKPELTLARDGQEALELLLGGGAAALPDLVIMDLNLPRLNGRELLAALREAQVAVPVVVLSGSAWEAERMRESGLPEDRCLNKPDTFRGYLELAARLASLGWLE